MHLTLTHVLLIAALILRDTRTEFSSILNIGGSPGDVTEEHVAQENGKKAWRMSCDVGEATEGLENEL